MASNNCFTFRYTGTIDPFIKLELQHPLTGGQPAMIMGERFILRDRTGARCAMSPSGEVRFAEFVRLPNKLGVLRRSPGGCEKILVEFEGLPSNIEPKIRCSAGAMSENPWAEVHEVDRATGASAFSLLPGGVVTLCLPSGEVKFVEWLHGTPAPSFVSLPIEKIMEARLDFIEFSLSRLGDDLKGEHIRKVDAILHEISKLIHLYRRSTTAIEVLYWRLLCKYVQYEKVRPGVRNGILSAFRECGYDNYARMIDLMFRGGNVVVLDTSGLKDSEASRKKRLERERKREARRLEDQQTRLRMRGGGGGQQDTKKKRG